MKGTLYIQRKRGRKIDKPEALECEIDLRKNDMAIAGVGTSVKAILRRAEVEAIAADGILIRGVEEAGFGLVHYQEWWFIPVLSSKE